MDPTDTDIRAPRSLLGLALLFLRGDVPELLRQTIEDEAGPAMREQGWLLDPGPRVAPQSSALH